MHLAHDALLGKKRQVAPHRLARSFQQPGQILDAGAARLLHQLGDAPPPFIGLHASYRHCLFRRCVTSRMTVSVKFPKPHSMSYPPDRQTRVRPPSGTATAYRRRDHRRRRRRMRDRTILRNPRLVDAGGRESRRHPRRREQGKQRASAQRLRRAARKPRAQGGAAPDMHHLPAYPPSHEPAAGRDRGARRCLVAGGGGVARRNRATSRIENGICGAAIIGADELRGARAAPFASRTRRAGRCRARRSSIRGARRSPT